MAGGAALNRPTPLHTLTRASRIAKGERGIYVHFNPVKHGLVAEAADWPYSSFHRCVDRGVYPTNWRADGDRGFAAGERSVLCFDGLHPSYRSLRGEFI